jgi:ABC-type multidrug transport system fused ATPase/permease subunit
MTRLLEDVTSVERVLIDGIEQGTVSVLQVGIVAGLMFATNPSLAALALLPIPLLIAGALAYTLTAHRRYRMQRKASSAMNALLHDNLAGIRQIKTYVREREEHARFNGVSQQLREATLVVMRTWAIYNPAMTFFASCGLVVVVGFGGRAVLSGAMSVGDLVGFPPPRRLPLRADRPPPCIEPDDPVRSRRRRARFRDPRFADRSRRGREQGRARGSRRRRALRRRQLQLR